MDNGSASRPAGLYGHSLGVGSEVVFLHGWGMHSGVWEDVVESLVDHHRITLVDLPGHGYSRLPEAGHSLKELSQAVAAVAPARAAWVGWSLGGLIAQRLAIDHPERVDKLVLVSSSPCFVGRADWPHGVEYRVLHAFAENLSRDYRATLKRFLALEVHGSEHEISQLRLLREMVFQHGEPDTAALRDGLAILESEDLRDEFKGITCPTLLLMGRRDNLVPVSAGPVMQHLLTGTRLHIFERAAHAPFFSHLEEFIGHLRDFLNV
jgi:pimeloyl-[acyl-carrier protein] methyl ester esterase